MNTGLLFYRARRTLFCQKELERRVSAFGLSVSEAHAVAKEENLQPAMASLITALPLVFLVSGAAERRPDCAAALFSILRIPSGADGEPKGVLRLPGQEKVGYLIESVNQAILLLPDLPEEICAMLPPALERLREKFSLGGDLRKPPAPDYELLAERSIPHG